MNRILLVAQREFMATITTKGFIVGILLTPAIIGAVIVFSPMLIRDDAPHIEGQFALLDRSGATSDSIASYLSLEEMAKRREEEKDRALEQIPEGVQALSSLAGPETDDAIDEALGKLPAIEVRVLSLMGAIGAAVNDIREAQALMMMVMIPWILWMPISCDPSSVLAVTMSFIPPLSSFVMLLRMSSTVPPPMWQVWLSLAVGAVGVYGSLWFAAKSFESVF